MASTDPPAISTPSRPRYSLNPKRSGTFAANPATPNVAGFSPGGQVFEGYSYLTRSTSMSTSTRSRPKGLQTATPPAPLASNLPNSPSSPRLSRLASSPPASPFADTPEVPRRSNTIHRMSSSISTPELHSIGVHPPRSESESERLAEAVANLPHNPKIWLPSQVALYLTHVLGLVPRPVVEDVTAYVRTSRMGGRAFLRLSEKDLERQGLNLKWRKLMIEAVRKLRRDALRGRIWGYESGSIRWPKSAQDLAREEAEDLDDSELAEGALIEQDGVVRSSSATSKLTLKRMRDSRKVRGMIQAFQTSPDQKTERLPPSSPLDAVYGEGYVRGQAQHILSEAEQKKLSLRRPLRPRRSTADFPWLESPAAAKKEDIEALLSGLSQQEADELANELGLNDLNDTDAVGRALQQDQADEHKRHLLDDASTESADEVVLMPTLTRHGSEDSLSMGDSSVSECSVSESEADADADAESRGHKPRYSVLDEDIIRAILAEADHADASHPDAAVAIREEGSNASPKAQLTRSHTTASILRPERPYRASLYTDEELEALDTNPLHVRTESSRELVQALGLSGTDAVDDTAEPQFGTARLRSAEERALDALALPNFDQATPSHQDAQAHPEPHASDEDGEKGEYVFMPPEPSARKPLSQVGSIRRAGRGDATFGSRRGKAVLSLLSQGDSENSELFASLPGATMLRQKSSEARKSMVPENEAGWGGTLGRSSSRKSVNSVFDGPAAFPKRSLDRVASEAEAESAWAQLDTGAQDEAAEENEAQEMQVEAPVDRYEDTATENEGEAAMLRRPSVEQRLSSLFIDGDAPADVHAAEPGCSADASTAVEEVAPQHATEEIPGTGLDEVTVEPKSELDETPAADIRDQAEAAEPAPELVSDQSSAGAQPEAAEVTKAVSATSEDEPAAAADSDNGDDHAGGQEPQIEASAVDFRSEAEDAAPAPAPEIVAESSRVDAQSAAVDNTEVASTISECEAADAETQDVDGPADGSDRQLDDVPAADIPSEVEEVAATPALVSDTAPTVETESVEATPDPATPAAGEAESDDFVAIAAPTASDETAENGASPPAASIGASAKPAAEPVTAEAAGSKLLVPLTVVEAHPSGTGSIQKRSMVLVDRRRFESLARRMTDLEQQLESIDRPEPPSRGAKLQTMFDGPDEGVPTGAEADEILDAVLAASQAQPPATEAKTAVEVAKDVGKGGWWKPSSWVTYLSSLNPYYSEQTRAREEEEDEISLDALLGRPESDEEKHLLAIGAIPAYMLGLGAGVGFVLVREVLGKGIARS